MTIFYFLINKVRMMSKQYSRTKRFKEYTDIHRVFMLFDLVHAEEVKAFAKTLTEEGKEVRCLSFNPNVKVEAPELPENFQILNCKNLSFTGFPLVDVMESFKSYHPDTLIDLTVNPHPVLQYLSLQSDADYRVGFMRGEKTVDDLLLEYEPGQGFDYLTSQLHFYMKSIRAK